MCQHIGGLQMQGGIDDLTATKAMGMGSWRLKGAMEPPFEGLTAQVEGLWRHMLDRDLKLYPMDKVTLTADATGCIITSPCMMLLAFLYLHQCATASHHLAIGVEQC